MCRVGYRGCRENPCCSFVSGCRAEPAMSHCHRDSPRTLYLSSKSTLFKLFFTLNHCSKNLILLFLPHNCYRLLTLVSSLTALSSIQLKKCLSFHYYCLFSLGVSSFLTVLMAQVNRCALRAFQDWFYYLSKANQSLLNHRNYRLGFQITFRVGVVNYQIFCPGVCW